MKSVFRVAVSVGLAYVAVLLTAPFIPTLRHAFILPEGVLALAGVFYFVLHRIARKTQVDVALGLIDTRETEKREPGLVHQLVHDESGQDIAEYAVMLAVILVIVVATVRMIGSQANNVFSQVGSAIQQ